MNDTTLKSSNKENYIGVTINCKLLRFPHVDIIISRANNTRQFLQKKLKDYKKDIKLKLVYK